MSANRPVTARTIGAERPVADDLAMAVVVRRELVLVQRRYRSRAGFVHEFPGGTVNRDETWETAAARELSEETGLREFDSVHRSVYHAEEGRCIAFVVFRSCSTAPPNQTCDRRQQSFFWLASEAIPLHDFHAADRQFIVEELPAALAASRSDRDAVRSR